MKAYIWTTGDPSVGIQGENAEVEIEYWEDLFERDPEMREDHRSLLSEAFSEILDGKAYCRFEDECKDD